MKSEWDRVQVGALCSRVCSGGTPKSTNSEYYGGDIPWLNTREVNFNFISRTEGTITQAGLDNSSAKWIKKNCVIVAMYGATAGRCAITKIPLTTNQACCNLEIDEARADYRFVYYALKNEYIRLSSAANGGAQQNLNAQQVKEFDIPYPPLPIQRKIASILSALDDKIETNNAICRNLEEQSQALFSSFYHIESKETPFTDIIQILGGGTPKTGEDDYWNGVIPFFTPKDVQSPYTFNTEKTLSELGLKNCNSKLYPQGTTFVTARGTVGKIAMAGIPMAMNQSCYALVSEKLHPLLVYYYALEVVLSLKQKSSGSVFDAIVTRDFNGESINLLSKKSTSEFLRLSVSIHEKIRDILLENEKIAIMRDAILPKLMKGELDLDKIEL